MAQAVEVEFNGVVHFAFDAVSRLARGDAAGEIGRIGGIAGRSFFNDDQVPAHFNPGLIFLYKSGLLLLFVSVRVFRGLSGKQASNGGWTA
jgi:hypothetical protein